MSKTTDKFDLDDQTIEAALDSAVRVIQNRLGVTDGGIAGLYFSGEERSDFAEVMRGYARCERDHAAPIAPKAENALTIEAFRKSRLFEHDADEPPRFVYLGGDLTIELVTGSFTKHFDEAHAFYLQIANCEYFSDDLSELEQRLFGWAESEGYTLDAAATVDAIMRAAGYEIWDTGGGCTCWGKNCGDGTSINISAESSHRGSAAKAEWSVGRYGEQGGFVEISPEAGLTLKACIDLAGKIPSPIRANGSLIDDVFDSLEGALLATKVAQSEKV